MNEVREFYLILTDNTGKEMSRRKLRIQDTQEALHAEAYRAQRMIEELYRDVVYHCGLLDKYRSHRVKAI